MIKRFKQKPKKLLIFGCGGHSKVITDIAKSIGFSDIFYQDINTEIMKFLGGEVYHDEINDYKEFFFVALGDNYIREKITNNFQFRNPQAIPATLIHPSSYVSENCIIGEGSVVMPLCVLNSFTKIGKGVIINTRSSLDHDNKIMDFASIAPGVTTGGNVQIGERTAISIGTTIKNNIEIGLDCVVGACSYVNKDIRSNLVAYGTPAKPIRDRVIGEKYL